MNQRLLLVYTSYQLTTVTCCATKKIVLRLPYKNLRVRATVWTENASHYTCKLSLPHTNDCKIWLSYLKHCVFCAAFFFTTHEGFLKTPLRNLCSWCRFFFALTILRYSLFYCIVLQRTEQQDLPHYTPRMSLKTTQQCALQVPS